MHELHIKIKAKSKMEGETMYLYDLVKPLGIVIYSLFLITAITGVFKFRNTKLKPATRIKFHKILAIVALIGATLHGSIVIFSL